MQMINQDLLAVASGTIAHQVNCQGVMGAGLAKKIADKWPCVRTQYLQFVSHNQSRQIDMMGLVQYVQVSDTLYVANCFAQRGYGYGPDGQIPKHTSYGALVMCLETLSEPAFHRPVHIPLGMGCGLGGGNWMDVSKLIDIVAPTILVCKLT